jgi:hypothetical protein
MPDNTPAQTPAPASGDGNTPAPNNGDVPKEETYTKAQLTELIQKEIGKVTAKHSKKEADLQAALDAEKKKSLPDPEKVKLEIAERDKKIAEAETKLANFEALGKKRDALDGAKLTLPADVTISDLLGMMPGNSDEEITAYVEKFKKMFPASVGVGTPTNTGNNQEKPKSLRDQLADLNNKLADPKISDREKRVFASQIITLNRKIMMGET